MNCPFCRSRNTKVIDKRDNEETNATRRRRECEDCGRRFTTYERIERVLINVKKRSGTIQEFNREKLKLGILKAVKKRMIPDEEIEGMLDEIEQDLMARDDQTVESTVIGDMVLKGLNKIDKLGALLFAAVYKEFATLEEVEEELRRLSK